MNEDHIQRIATELNVQPRQVAATGKLIIEGATVPFIARYRKEVTGSLDEVAITSIRDRITELANLDQRRQAIIKSLDERSLLTDALKKAVMEAPNMARLEDVFQPYRPKRRTRATIAREAGLEPLADRLFEHQNDATSDAENFIDATKGIEDIEQALAGARDIIAEKVSDDPTARGTLRRRYEETGEVRTNVMYGKEEEGAKFKDYFDWQEPLSKMPSHRLLAIRRGESEGILIMQIAVDNDVAVNELQRQFVNGNGPAAEQVKLAVEDGFKRLLRPTIEVENRLNSKKLADIEAIRVFADNLKELLMAPALGEKRVLAIDPGFRTGCKIVCLDAQGKLLHHGVIYPTIPGPRVQEAKEMVLALCAKLKIEAIAIGNGTASRETEAFVRGLGLPSAITVVMVNESGASVYSASDAAREEFPNEDLTVRGSVSIGRRLMDPLAELVKIEAKSIGVGQYQHDVDQILLKKGLDDVVVSCVNGVGVELNTASRQLLSYVSGLGPQLAGNIIEHRNENGPFKSRAELKKVARLGPKAFEQAAGFLRIRGAKNPLDASAVHPERYDIVKQMAKDLSCTVADLINDPALRQRIDVNRYITDEVGLPTLNDIVQELAKPGRDPRKQFEVFSFQEGVETMNDLKPGMKLPGIVTNVTAFGAFVDIGVHQDGLVHISQLADRFVQDPAEVVKVQQKVMVTVMEVDIDRKRIGLSMLTNPELPSERGQSPRRAQSRPSSRSQQRPAKKQEPVSVTNDWFSQAMAKAEER
ncbi:MAG: Tex family protein, partial [Limisphaerales bacterium]